MRESLRPLRWQASRQALSHSPPLRLSCRLQTLRNLRASLFLVVLVSVQGGLNFVLKAHPAPKPCGVGEKYRGESSN